MHAHQIRAICQDLQSLMAVFSQSPSDYGAECWAELHEWRYTSKLRHKSPTGVANTARCA